MKRISSESDISSDAGSESDNQKENDSKQDRLDQSPKGKTRRSRSSGPSSSGPSSSGPSSSGPSSSGPSSSGPSSSGPSSSGPSSSGPSSSGSSSSGSSSSGSSSSGPSSSSPSPSGRVALAPVTSNVLNTNRHSPVVVSGHGADQQTPGHNALLASARDVTNIKSDASTSTPNVADEDPLSARILRFLERNRRHINASGRVILPPMKAGRPNATSHTPGMLAAMGASKGSSLKRRLPPSSRALVPTKRPMLTTRLTAMPPGTVVALSSLERLIKKSKIVRLLGRIMEYRSLIVPDSIFESLDKRQIVERFTSKVYFQLTVKFLEGVTELALEVGCDYNLDLALLEAAQHLLSAYMFYNKVIVAIAGPVQAELVQRVHEQSANLVCSLSALARYATTVILSERGTFDEVTIAGYITSLERYHNSLSSTLMEISEVQHNKASQEMAEVVVSVYKKQRRIENDPSRDKRERYDELGELFKRAQDEYGKMVSPEEVKELAVKLKELRSIWAPDVSQRSALEDNHEAAIDPHALLDCFSGEDHNSLKASLLFSLSGRILDAYGNDQLLLAAHQESVAEKGRRIEEVITDVYHFATKAYRSSLSSHEKDSAKKSVKMNPYLIESRFYELKAELLSLAPISSYGVIDVSRCGVDSDEVKRAHGTLEDVGSRFIKCRHDFTVLMAFTKQIRRVLLRIVRDPSWQGNVRERLADSHVAACLFSSTADLKEYLRSIFQFLFECVSTLLTAARRAEFGIKLRRLQELSEMTDNLGILCAESAETVLNMINAVQYDRVLKVVSGAPERVLNAELESEKKKIQMMLGSFEMNFDNCEMAFSRLFPTLSLEQGYSEHVVDHLVHAQFIELITGAELSREEYPHSFILDYRRFLDLKQHFQHAVARYVSISSLVWYCHANSIDMTLLDHEKLVGHMGEALLESSSALEIAKYVVQVATMTMADVPMLELSSDHRDNLEALITKHLDPQHQCYRISANRVSQVVKEVLKLGVMDPEARRSVWFVPVVKSFVEHLKDIPRLLHNHLYIYKQHYQKMMKDIQVHGLVSKMIGPTVPTRESLGNLLQLQYDELSGAHRYFNNTVTLAAALALTQAYTQDLTHSDTVQAADEVDDAVIAKFIETHPYMKTMFERKQYSREQIAEFIADYNQLPLLDKPSVKLVQLRELLMEKSFFTNLNRLDINPSTIVALLIIIIPKYLMKKGFKLDQAAVKQYAEMLKLLVTNPQHAGRKMYARNIAMIIHRFMKRGGNKLCVSSVRDAASYTLREPLQQLAAQLNTMFLTLLQQANERDRAPGRQVPLNIRSGFRI